MTTRALAPVLVAPPAEMPVTLDMFKTHARIDHSDDDEIAGAYLTAAVAHLDGWTGILGRALVTQTWRQDFLCFHHCVRLPLHPVVRISSVVWRDAAGTETTIDAANYVLSRDALGAFVQFRSGYVLPTSLAEIAPVSVTYICGQDVVDVPGPIKIAILLLAGHWYANREAVGASDVKALPFAVDALISPFRRISV